ncbi:putative signal transducing protein [Lysobacter xanthus]
MRQVFSSARLENVERVAALMRDAGIEVRITDGRSYKGGRRSTVSYRDSGESTRPALWVVRSEDSGRAREILREAGLLDSTRPGDAKLRFRSEFGDETTRTPAQKRATRVKAALLAGMVIVIVMMFARSGRTPPVPQVATGPLDGRSTATLIPVAQAVFQKELADIDTPVACLSVDRRDATREVRDVLRPRPGLTLVPASHCERIADEDRGSVHPQSKQKATFAEIERFRPTAPDVATVEYTAYHHRMWAKYKTLEVRRVDGAWQVTKTLKVVAP